MNPDFVDHTTCVARWSTAGLAVQRQLGLLSEWRVGNGFDHFTDSRFAWPSIRNHAAECLCLNLISSLADLRVP
jgi:hypothetical protein